MKILIIYMFMCSSLSFVINRKHLLLMLLSLEFMVLSLFLGLSYILVYQGFELYFMLIYLCFSVCEGVLGLSLLVFMIRMYGNDYFQSFSILW